MRPIAPIAGRIGRFCSHLAYVDHPFEGAGPLPGLRPQGSRQPRARVPSSPSNAGNIQTAESITMTTVIAAPMESPTKKLIPMSSSPSSPTTTAKAAKTTARPDVLTATRAAFCLSSPSNKPCR